MTNNDKKILKRILLNETWKDKLHNVYDNDFEEFCQYDEMYNIANRLGYDNVHEAWNDNPIISGSTNPEDLHVISSGIENESAPPGGEKVVKALKKNPEVENPYATAWSMKNKGYHFNESENKELLKQTLKESLAFEITDNDIEEVLMDMYGYDAVKMDPTMVDEISSILDYDSIENAALYGNDMDEQTRYAYKEIEKQINDYKGMIDRNGDKFIAENKEFIKNTYASKDTCRKQQLLKQTLKESLIKEYHTDIEEVLMDMYGYDMDDLDDYIDNIDDIEMRTDELIKELRYCTEFPKYKRQIRNFIIQKLNAWVDEK
jgi:hypothetical protein